MTKTKKRKSLIFPNGFLWGTATSAHQVEGGNRMSDWFDWEEAGKISVKSGKGVDHYHTFAADFAIAKLLNNNAHRLSLEWSRIEPKKGVYDSREILHYKKVLRVMRTQGLQTFVTLHHFTNPRWFTARGGFEQAQNIQYFTRFARMCAKEFGSLVDFWITLNEPMTYIFQGYITGAWPPGKRNLLSATLVMRHMAHAHSEAYQALHRVLPDARVGLSYNMIEFYPKTRSLGDLLLARLMSFLENELFYIWTGPYHDFWGINYYTRHSISLARLLQGRESLNLYGILQDNEQRNGWSMDPRGLAPFLAKICRRMHIPVYITEHGIADSSDRKRRKLLLATLRALHSAIARGVDIRGYFHWSLIDNFEWHLGFAPKFGLYRVHPRTLKRTPRQSARLYGQISKANGLVFGKGIK